VIPSDDVAASWRLKSVRAAVSCCISGSQTPYEIEITFVSGVPFVVA
jgi:hypothetical protein